MSMGKCLPADLPVGFRFEPKVEEIIFHYLGLKMIGKDSEVDHVIRELNFYDFDPRDLPAQSRIKSDDQIWWFFCRQEIGKTNKRTTESGHWEITGETQKLMALDNKTCIGKKKILVFYMGKSRPKSRGSKPIWVVHEYHPLEKNPQRPYIICRLQKRTEEKAGTQGCYVGEPSGSDSTASVIENPVTPAAVSGVHCHGEENADPPEQPLLSPSCYITLEDIISIFSDQENNSGMHENHPNPENSLSHQEPCVISHLENKTDEMDGTPFRGIGKPSGDITSDVENQEAPIATPEVHGRAQENADSPLSRDFGLTEEDMISILSNFPTDGQQIDSGMDEFHLVPENSLLHKGPYVISGVENKTDEKAGSPGCYVGEPSGDITSDVENQEAPILTPEAHGRAEENADSPLLQDFGLTEDMISILSNFPDDGQQIDLGMDEFHLIPENSLLHKGPYVISGVENKTDEKAGSPGCYVGEPSGDITSDVENQEAPILTPEVHGCAEENADSPLLQDFGLTEEDMISILSSFPNDGQQIDLSMDEFRLIPENSLLHKGPYVISSVENKTDEKAGSPGCYVGEPSGNITPYIGNQVVPTAIPEECGRTEVNAGSLSHPFVSPDCHFTEKYTTLNFSNSFIDNQNNMKATCEADDKEAVEFVDGLIVDPSENYNGEMTNNLSNGSIQPTSLKRLSSSVDTGIEGVNGRFKRSRTLASENHSDG